jgi:polysaccharide biosynthesis protein PslF
MRFPSPLTIGMLSTFPPTRCGLATFSSALTRTLEGHGHRVQVVPVEQAGAPAAGLPAPALRPGSSESRSRTAAALSATDVVIIQHEYGIFGGRDGEELLELVDMLEVPVLAVLHTVLAVPSQHQRAILERLCERSERVIVMSQAARELLLGGYSISPAKVTTIPHGAAIPHGSRERSASGRVSLLSWGLIGPGKGIEHVIGALGLLDQLGLEVQYTVAGSTHPKVLAREGTSYRDMLMLRTRDLRVEHLVTFDETYRDVDALTAYIASFDVVILPYDATQQVTSGVLVDSIAAGRAIISTGFPHAVEMLGDGAGMLVAHRDPRAIAVAIHTLVTESGTLEHMQATAAALAPQLSWDAVAGRYLEEIDTIMRHGARA